MNGMSFPPNRIKQQRLLRTRSLMQQTNGVFPPQERVLVKYTQICVFEQIQINLYLLCCRLIRRSSESWPQTISELMSQKRSGKSQVIPFSIKVDPAVASYEQWLNLSMGRDCRGCENNPCVVNRLLPDSDPLRHNVMVVQHQTGGVIHNWRLKPGPSVAAFHKKGTSTTDQFRFFIVKNVWIYSETQRTNLSRRRCTLRVSLQNPSSSSRSEKIGPVKEGGLACPTARDLPPNHTLQRSLLPPCLNRQLPLIRSPLPLLWSCLGYPWTTGWCLDHFFFLARNRLEQKE